MIFEIYLQRASHHDLFSEPYVLLSDTPAQCLAQLASEMSICYYAGIGSLTQTRSLVLAGFRLELGQRSMRFVYKRKLHCDSSSGARVLLPVTPARSSGYFTGEMSCFNQNGKGSGNMPGSSGCCQARSDRCRLEMSERFAHFIY